MERIHFAVNGRSYSVGREMRSDITLNDYLRKYLNLRGTKFMCREGVCGSCIVSATVPDVNTGQARTFAVNSCLVSITSCKDWEITTIEGIGHRGKGYHPVQETLAKFNGTQCGYCSPGWVMSMYNLIQSKGAMTKAEIEDSVASNTCRCTGYRPILDALKSFASDANNTLTDIEDLKTCKNGNTLCKQNSCESDDWCVINDPYNGAVEIDLADNKKWYRASALTDVFNTFVKEGTDSYMLIGGNTGKGAFPIDEYPNVLIDISAIKELKGHSIDQNLVIGAGTTLSDATEIFKQNATQQYFEYLDKFYHHIKLVAHIPVKNIGTIAGNLMLKHEHREFPSDLFLLFTTVGASLTIQSKDGSTRVSMLEFLNTDMKGKVIVNVLLPPYNNKYSLVTFKIMPRSQNATVLVNAGFLYKTVNNKIAEARIVFGGLSPNFSRATLTESYLLNKNLFDNTTLQGALGVLKNELIVDEHPTKGSVEFRKKLALGLFYKGILELCPPNILSPKYKSGKISLRTSRPVSKGKQAFDTNKAIWPLNKPIPKVEALIQCAGEANYIDDVPTRTNEVYAAFVLSTVPVGDIDVIDPSPALALNGVVAFYSAKDIPGKNTFTPPNFVIVFIDEEALCSGKIQYYNQPIGIIVAETENLAQKAAKLVKVTYKNVQKPVIHIKEAKKILTRNTIAMFKPATGAGINIKKTIAGSTTFLSQLHYTMETQVCFAEPNEDGLDVRPSTQWMDINQDAISQALNIQMNRVNMSVRLVGGAFGSKITRAGQIAVGCSLVAFLLNRPCRFIVPFTTVNRAIGKRFPCSSDYLVSVSGTGEIQTLSLNIFEDNGFAVNEPITLLGYTALKNCYAMERWTLTLFDVKTDTAKNSWMRAPGTLEQIGMIETIMERISYEMSLDPISVRMQNLAAIDDIKEVIETLKTEADYDNRKVLVQKFNETNQWKKRGLRFAPLKWPIPLTAFLTATISVYHSDGSVVITHGGIEIGQGINTKVAQVCAYTLDISMDKVKVKASNVISNANSDVTAGSVISESACYAIIKCCQIILDRLAPIKITLGDVTWEILVRTAHAKGVTLVSSYTITPNDQKAYSVFGASLTETEIDVLTGDLQVLRVDLLEDVGQSLSPAVDVGQIEGAFIMGLGYWTTENIVIDETTGEILSDRAWNYHVPLAKDIPIDFRVYFKRGSFNESGVLGSKATGEPAICMSICVAFAIREAIAAVRSDKGIPTTEWFNMVGHEIDSEVTLNDYLRNYLNLRGTKNMCKEGGCGACVVSVCVVDPETYTERTFSVNSCLVSVTSCKDWDITTIEEVGNREKGYHPIQTTLAKKNGTQCGFCSPGWVMSMFSLLKDRKKLTMAEIEDSFGSNTCRCTGIRPIMDAFKTFAIDAPTSLPTDLLDIEDLSICKRAGRPCRKDSCEDDDWCLVKKGQLQTDRIRIELRDHKVWYRACTVGDIFHIWETEGDYSYMLVAGNTGKGAYPIEEYPNILIDISGVNSLKGYSVDQNLILNAGNSIADCVKIFEVMSNEYGFGYLEKFISHINLVAHIPVKNIGTIAGNLMLKHQHNEFSSDLFLLFQTVGAILTIQSRFGIDEVTLTEFLRTDMRGKVIVNIKLPPLGRSYTFVSFKIMPRGQNAHAIVNAGFLYKLGADHTTVVQANIVFGGLSPKFVNAVNTEAFLYGKNLFRNETLQDALKILHHELIVEPNPPEPSAQFRKKLALGLFYKGLLQICPQHILGGSYCSGAINQRFARPVSHGIQVYDTNKSVWPLNKPMPKVEALIQCAGEAPYVDDIPTLPGEVFAAFVLSTVAQGDIEHIDATFALNIEGVLAFYSAQDIPGKNNFTPLDGLFITAEEEVLCNGKVKYFNQPIGVIVAITEKLANRAAKLVKIAYRNVKKPILSISEAKKFPERVVMFSNETAKNKGVDVNKVINGAANIYSQYHFTMETQICVTKPSEDGLDVYPSTQWMDKIQWGIAEALNIDKNRINMSVRRIGGGYGARITRSGQIAIACSLVTYQMNRPCRFIMPLTSVMRAIGKRLPCSSDFEVGVNSSGEIQYLQYNIYDDNGYIINEPIIRIGSSSSQNCYRKDRWNFKTFNVITDSASNSWCRSPGTLELIAMIEFIMEQISYEMSLDPIDVRVANLLNEPDIMEHIRSIKKDADYENRKKAVQKFNTNNRWKKRGLRFAPLRWEVPNLAFFAVTITVYHGDGSIAITHAGIEMGQGINTKAIQVCGYSLNVPIEKIKVKASNVLSNPNSSTTGGSFTSEAICAGVIKCCNILLERLKPIKASLGDVSWEEVIKKAHEMNVNLFVNANATPADLKPYYVYGATLAEVEVDILTGELQVLRVDILEDVGQSLSPEVDVGQVEGAFVMGLGYWTCENLVYDKRTGELLTDRTWNYHVPLAKDIPIDFRVYFKRNSYNELGVLGSKATGEPAICMTIAVAFAVREAIASARADRGTPTTQWFNIDGPCTNEAIVDTADARIEDFKFY